MTQISITKNYKNTNITTMAKHENISQLTRSPGISSLFMFFDFVFAVGLSQSYIFNICERVSTCYYFGKMLTNDFLTSITPLIKRLPNLFIIIGLYSEYVEEMRFLNVTSVSESYFCKLWRDELKNIVIPEVIIKLFIRIITMLLYIIILLI